LTSFLFRGPSVGSWKLVKIFYFFLLLTLISPVVYANASNTKWSVAYCNSRVKDALADASDCQLKCHEYYLAMYNAITTEQWNANVRSYSSCELKCSIAGKDANHTIAKHGCDEPTTEKGMESYCHLDAKAKNNMCIAKEHKLFMNNCMSRELVSVPGGGTTYKYTYNCAAKACHWYLSILKFFKHSIKACKKTRCTRHIKPTSKHAIKRNQSFTTSALRAINNRLLRHECIGISSLDILLAVRMSFHSAVVSFWMR
jgi:hypothetical protein